MSQLIPIDGNQNLQTQQDSLQFIELSGPAKVLDYTKKPNQTGATQKVNLAAVQQLPFSASVPDLLLIEVEPGDNPVSIIATQLATGKVVAFHSRVFVSGVEKEVLGFR